MLEDRRLAAATADEAGSLLLTLRAEIGHEDPEVLKDEADRRSHELILARLTEQRPEDAVLSEEGTDDVGRLGSRRVWIVDPLDGTREFGEPGRTDWAIHVALAVDGVPVIGAVALPGLGTTLSCERPPSVPTRAGGSPRVIASRTRPGPAAEAIATALSGEVVFMGSAGAKAMAVVRGEADVYAHTGGQYEWDNCAPVAVALAAGLHASRLDGSPLAYNNADPYLPDLLICRPEFADAAIEAAAGLS